MNVKEHSHLRGQNGCLGFFYGLDALLSAYPEGGLPGEFFINGKTQSIWIWDATGRSWYDTNHAAPAPFFGLVTDPSTFSPSVESGKSACFVYVAGEPGTYVFPALKSSPAITVVTDSAAIVTLVWDGAAWRCQETPVPLDDLVRPTHMYRGTWARDVDYTCTNGIADVVYYQGRYYQVKQSVGHTTQEPTATSDWEVVPRFHAVANKLEMLPDDVMTVDGQQAIRITGGDSSWNLSNGEIRHLETGTFLSQAGEMRVAVKQGEIVISPVQNAMTFARDGKRNLIIDWDIDGNIRLLLYRRDENGSNQLLVLPDGITLSKSNSEGAIVGSSRITVDGLNCNLKLWSDTLAEGDIYVDENNFLKQKRG